MYFFPHSDTESINVPLSSQTTVNTTQTTEYNHNTIISEGTYKVPNDKNDSNNSSLPDFERFVQSNRSG